MSIRAIDVGQVPNDGTGDDLRQAFVKVNENFTELNNRTGPKPFAVNNLIGPGQGLYAREEDNTFFLKNLEAGQNVTVSATNDSVRIDASGGIDEILVVSDDGHITLDDSKTFYIQGSTAGSAAPLIRTRVSNQNSLFIELKDSGLVEYDTRPALSQSLNANNNNINDVERLEANTITGNLEGTVYDIDVRKIEKYFDNYWNFNGIIPGEFANIVDYLNYEIDVDMGTVNEPAEFTIDGGEITE